MTTAATNFRVSRPTKGPWTYDRSTGQVDVSTGTICNGISWAANGPLIAAAPELLEALTYLVAQAPSSARGSLGKAMDAAYKAIAKAEGM